MKIGFLGNTNNFPFMLARAFARLGHEVLFIVHRPESLHRPEHRYSDVEVPYPPWIQEVLLPQPSDFVTGGMARSRAVRLLRSCDLVILNDLGVSMAGEMSCPCVALLTGSDLSYYCDPSSGQRVLADMTTRNPLKQVWGTWLWKRILHRQRHGVRHCQLVFHFQRGLIPSNDAILDGLQIEDARRLFFLMADVHAIPYTPVPCNEMPRTFCATRLTWQYPMLRGDSPLDYKGTDIMVRGLGLYRRQGGSRLDIQLVRKGRHVRQTIDLLATEGLADWTRWHNEMSQAEVWRQYQQSDLVFEQFGQGIVAMAGLEAMAAGRPVIANGRPEIFQPLLGEPSAVCQATKPEEVCQQLQRLVTDPDLRVQIGQQSRRWVEKHFAPEVAAGKILERLATRDP